MILLKYHLKHVFNLSLIIVNFQLAETVAPRRVVQMLQSVLARAGINVSSSRPLCVLLIVRSRKFILIEVIMLYR